MAYTKTNGVLYEDGKVVTDAAKLGKYYFSTSESGATSTSSSNKKTQNKKQTTSTKSSAPVGSLERTIELLGYDPTKQSAPGTTSNTPNLTNNQPTTNTPPATSGSQVHVVQSGETLSSIAKRLGVSVADISGYRSGNPNLIYPGERLTIGGQQTAGQDQGAMGQGETTPGPLDSLMGNKEDKAPAVTSEQARKDFLKDLGIGAAPTPPDLFTKEDEQTLRENIGQRDVITSELETIANDKMALDEEMRKFRLEKTGLPEAGRIGAISEEERNFGYRMDALNRREAVLEMKLSNRNSTISELRTLQRTEYADAVSAYNNSYNQAIKIYDILDSQADDLKTDAKANLSVLAELYSQQLTAGTITELTGVQKAKLEELEAQADLPVGSTAAIIEAQEAIRVAGGGLEYKATVGSSEVGYSALFVGEGGEVKVVPIIGGTGPDDNDSRDVTTEALNPKSTAEAFVAEKFQAKAFSSRESEIKAAKEAALIDANALPVGQVIEGTDPELKITQAWKDSVIAAINAIPETRDEANRIKNLELE